MASLPDPLLDLTIVTDPKRSPSYSVWWGDPLRIRCTLPEGMTFDGIAEVVCEIKPGGVMAESGAALAYVSVEPDESASVVEFTFTADAMAALPITRREGQYWMVISLVRENPALGKITFFGGALTAVRHNSTLQPVEAPVPGSSLLATRVELDAEEAARIAGDEQLAEDLTTEQTARIDGDAATLTTANGRYLRYDAAQGLSGGQKTQVLANAGAAPQSQVDTISNGLDAEVSDRQQGDADTLDAANGYTDDSINALINGAPGALDTLLELAGALGDDPGFSATVAAQLGANAAAIAAEETARYDGDLANHDDIVLEQAARIAADALLLSKAGNLTELDSPSEALENIGGAPLYGMDVENFLGSWIHVGGHAGRFNWTIVGAGTQGLWSNASILPHYPGAPTLYANNGSFFNYVAPSASAAAMVGVSFDFTFRTDYLGASTAMRYFVGWRNSASTSTDVGSRGLFWEAGDTNWSLLHTTSAGVQTKVDTGMAYAANVFFRVIVTVVSATETTLELRREGFSPVTVNATTGFSMSGILGLGFALWSTAANNRYVNPCRAVLHWPIPSL